MENQKDLVTQRTWRRILEHLTPVKGYKAAERKVSWYRGLSQSQMAAANALFDILRENMDKNTTSNVAKLMVKLGLHPYPPWKTLHMVIKLSRGNDLAFLWFLMEMCYKTPNHGETYSVNEQIIMTAIFRLDLFPTLRELDRWLPLPHSSQSDRDKADVSTQRNQRLKKKRRMSAKGIWPESKDREVSISLLSRTLYTRKIRNERKLLSDYPDTAATLFHMDEEPLEAYLWSRWFGTYTLNDAHRVGKSIIFEEINNIFKSFKAASLPTRDVESLCAHHQYIREMEKSLKDKLEMMKRRKCVELIEAKNRLEERKRKRVIQELEEMSACYLKRFQEMAARARLASTRNEEEDSHHEMAAIPSAHSVQEPKLFDLGLLGRNCARFNYRELFGSLQRTQLDDERMRLKEAFVRAIDDDVQYLSAALSGEEEGSLDALVDQAAKRVFAQDVKAFHEELKKMNKQKAAKEYNPDSRLNFGQEFYDPENIPLMKEMLRLGLEKVAQDKRYVLPTLPDVHSVPYLIEWIRLRYGKRYSYGEKKQILNRDKLVMDQITWMMHTNLEKIPTLPVGDNFTDLAKLRGLTKKLRERYTNKFLEAIMEVERVFYSAMKPHLCNLATEETFLAYLPAHFHDLGFTVNTVS
ncbi:GD21553 [Drosophila simulans]|uniref:GD21553 n=1 Tax=Drosophila simulans TaxID=7240 RepID=B4R2B7_DROSI|nr:GD21553 [Drosophila simulans]